MINLKCLFGHRWYIVKGFHQKCSRCEREKYELGYGRIYLKESKDNED